MRHDTFLRVPGVAPKSLCRAEVVRAIRPALKWALCLATVAGALCPSMWSQGALIANVINITTGGTYSGNWVSTNPSVPAVTISTDDPVIIQNSTIKSRGHLIVATGKAGANLTVRNVTGQALDPLVSGKARGAFVVAYIMNTLTVQNCTMIGTSFGVKSAFSTLSTMSVTNNIATDLEDRASDGRGGFLTTRPQLGHFLLMSQDVAPGAELAWNQVIQTIGSTSTEDVFNFYLSSGTAALPINVHDNYMEGYSSRPTTSTYTGNGIIADGDSTGATSYIAITANQMLHTAGGGVAIASGHDITASANRVVSCGMDASGNWYTDSHVSGIYLGNYYGSRNFTNNTIASTFGGLVAPDGSSRPAVHNVASVTVPPQNSISGSSFTDPCLVSAGSVNLGAEADERTYWDNKLKSNGQALGDLH